MVRVILYEMDDCEKAQRALLSMLDHKEDLQNPALCVHRVMQTDACDSVHLRLLRTKFRVALGERRIVCAETNASAETVDEDDTYMYHRTVYQNGYLMDYCVRKSMSFATRIRYAADPTTASGRLLLRVFRHRSDT